MQILLSNINVVTSFSCATLGAYVFYEIGYLISSKLNSKKKSENTLKFKKFFNRWKKVFFISMILLIILSVIIIVIPKMESNIYVVFNRLFNR